MKNNIDRPTQFLLMLVGVVACGYAAKNVLAQTNQISQSSLYVPLIGISSVPEPLALPRGPASVTYNYAVKNFLSEVPLMNVRVEDDKCSPVTFKEGDDNGDGKLDYGETWRYACTIKIFETTQSIATAIGTANGLPAAHKAYATVVVGSKNYPPLVNIINITKVAYPLTLPKEGGDITFTYRVNNPGAVPLSNVTVSDDKCPDMSGKLGDTNGNNLLDVNEVWTYTCTAHLFQTTTNTVSVTAFANNLKAVGYATITVRVSTVPGEGVSPGLPGQAIPSFPQTGASTDLKTIAWEVFTGVLAVLVVFFVVVRRKKAGKDEHSPESL